MEASPEFRDEPFLGPSQWTCSRICAPTAPFCLHGLAAVWLPESGWHRLDPRGDKPGIATRFAPPAEHLAYSPSVPGEADLPGVFAEPLGAVVAALERAADWRDLLDHLPDLTPPGPR